MPFLSYANYADRHPEFIERLGEARLGEARLWCDLQDANGRSRQRSLIHRYLTSYDVRLHAVYQGVRDTRQFHSHPPSKMANLAGALDLFAPLSEPIRRRTVERDGRRRPTVSFGPLARARQRIAADVLKAIRNPHPFQFTLSDGVTGALQALEQAFREGYVYGQEVDIVSFFPSIHLDGLVISLRPLPRAVVENVVWSGATAARHRRRIPTGAHSEGPLPPRVFRGLAQGSACSPIAADIVMSEVLAQLPTGSRFVCFADNVMMLGRTENGVAEQVDAFKSLLREHPAGPLGLRIKSPIDFQRQQFTFLGYEGLFSPINEHFSWAPRCEALDAIDQKIEERTASNASMYEGLAWLRQWRRGYPLWDAGEAWVPRKQFELLAKMAYSTDRATYRAILGRLVTLRNRMPPFSIHDLLPEAPPSPRRTKQRVMADINDLQRTNEAEIIGAGDDRTEPY